MLTHALVTTQCTHFDAIGGACNIRCDVCTVAARQANCRRADCWAYVLRAARSNGGHALLLLGACPRPVAPSAELWRMLAIPNSVCCLAARSVWPFFTSMDPFHSTYCSDEWYVHIVITERACNKLVQVLRLTDTVCEAWHLSERQTFRPRKI